MNARATMAAGVSWGVIGLEGSFVGGRGLAGGSDGWRVWTPACGCSQYSKPCTTSAVVSVKRLGKFRGGPRLNLVCDSAAVAGVQLRRRPTDICPAPSRRHAERSKGRAWDFSYHRSGLNVLEVNFVPDLGLSARTRGQSVDSGVDATPLEESKPDAEDHAQEQHSIPSVPGDFSEKPNHVGTLPEEGVSHVGGKTGSLSFYASGSDSSLEEPVESNSSSQSKSKALSLIWPLGPFILVASVVLPPLYLRKIFGAVLEDSLLTDFVILFFTETLFFVGASAFLYIAHISRQATGAIAAALEPKPASPVYLLGYRLSSKITLGIGVLLPMVTFVMVWPWTGPAAAAALAPYMIGLLVQLGFEHIIYENDSPVWPLVPVTFQMYRLHQLNRAAQLVAGLLFSLKGVDATAETMAINGSLQGLLFVLQVLGMLCLWSLGSFLTNQLPSNRAQTSIPSIP